jgi:hypothetical protein
LSKANQELQDLLIVAQLSTDEQRRFMDRVKKKLSADGITLDFLETIYRR